jgi:hypothetical protein
VVFSEFSGLVDTNKTDCHDTFRSVVFSEYSGLVDTNKTDCHDTFRSVVFSFLHSNENDKSLLI